MKKITRLIGLLVALFCIPSMTFCSITKSTCVSNDILSDSETDIVNDLSDIDFINVTDEHMSDLNLVPHVADDRICIRLTHSESVLEKTYTVDDFSNKHFSSIKDITSKHISKTSEKYYRIFVLTLTKSGEENVNAAIEFLADDERIQRAYTYTYYSIENISTTGSIII